MKVPNGLEIINLFEQFSPKNYAMEGDPIGLQIGRLNKKVTKVLVALDVVDEVVEEAIREDVQLIIAHHPLIYRPLKKIMTDTAPGQIVEKLIKHDIAVYAAHTNLDVARMGVNDMLADALGLKETEVLIPTFQSSYHKLAVYVPENTETRVREALGNAGAGAIGNYSHCSFTSEGTGRFLPGENTNPTIGAPGQPESVREVKIETIYPAEIEKKVLSAMIKAHPYEEPAYDIYKLENKRQAEGLGRIGILTEEMTLEQFSNHVKKVLDVNAVRVVGSLDSKIKKVAVLGGDGNKYFSQAKFKGADVYVTGDMYYHNAHDAMLLGLNIVDPGHNIEKVMKKGVAKIMANLCKKNHYQVEFIDSKPNTDPFTFI
ncbi:Nif3-like dinuclear metal center hexameric protein [Peribacillus sp. SCS-155]|uniref:Nif3-like dinuclear metal center hexameric protein n=1 Tax=Peribacillus sedimenti TaxID=3115297 RepID=UPI00390614AB